MPYSRCPGAGEYCRNCCTGFRRTAGGIAGVGWHIMHVDPPGIAIYIVEAGLAVAYWLLKKPKTPTLLILTQFLLYTDAHTV